MSKDQSVIQSLVRSVRALTAAVAFLLLFVAILFWMLVFGIPDFLKDRPEAKIAKAKPESPAATPPDTLWHAPDTSAIPAGAEGDIIRYGRNLVANTAYYLGPGGIVASITNGMNCQNCHLEAGTKIWGNNYSAVASTYPKFRARSGTMESITKRVNDCIERSLNGHKLDSASREMRAVVAYISWLGANVPKDKTPYGAGISNLPKMNRAADPEKGRALYAAKCSSCHGADGAGQKLPSGQYQYPPLWGNYSYNTGAGLYRLSRFAGYVKMNMPFGATWQNTQLSDDECWDLAAFVNSQPRPQKDLTGDWPDISKKPSDHPFGPFSDSFPEKQHKYGPFGPIDKAHKK